MKKIFTSLCLALSLLSCSTEADYTPEGSSTSGKVKVSFGQTLSIKSRTSVAEDGYTAIWSAGDKIALWAKDSAGEFALQAETFSLYHLTDQYYNAIFSAFIDPMPSGEYTYYATYPTPNAVDGTRATYTISSEQVGSTFVGNCDIMVATPTTGAELAEGVVNNLNFRFSHKMHALKIVLPDEGKLMDTPIDCIELTFPTAVVGDVTVDASSPTAPPVLSNGSNKLTVYIPDGYKAGDNIWAMIYPSYLSGDITYRVYAGDFISVEKSITVEKSAQESHISPMSVEIPDPYLTTTITVAIDQNYLGEEPTAVSITDTAGNPITISNYDYTTGRFDVLLEGVLDGASLAGQQYIAVFESANAIVQQTFTLPAIRPYRQNDIPVDVPYLLYEDFSGATAAESRDAYAASADEDQVLDGFLLNDWMTTDGWNAARFKIDAGNCIRLNVRYQSGGLVVGRYCGRLDTPALSKLKSGANVNIKVEFDLACYVPFGIIIGIGSVMGANEVLDDTNNSVTFYQISKHTSSETSALKGDNQGDISSEYSSPTFVRNVTEDTFNCSFWPQSVNISGVGPTTRITWWPSTTQKTSRLGANCVYYIYIDNIRISIAQ
ncbi:MAG: fimbrillin family protein [Alistipes sp.]|nr:fimbrillin family protein [Alistipes sp.]